MFCNQCGKQVAEGTKFCPACGNQFKQTTGASNAGPGVGRVVPPAPPRPAQATPMANQAHSPRPMQPTGAPMGLGQPGAVQPMPTPGQNRPAQVTPMQGNAPINGGMNGSPQAGAYGQYPPNWVGCLALIPNFKMCMTKKYASFTGRATRGEYWRFALANSVVSLLIITLIGLIFDNFIISYAAAGLLNLAFLLPYLGVTVRRLHDTGRAGWWLLISFVPLLSIAILVFMFLPSNPGPNKYGLLPDYTYYAG